MCEFCHNWCGHWPSVKRQNGCLWIPMLSLALLGTLRPPETGAEGGRPKKGSNQPQPNTRRAPPNEAHNHNRRGDGHPPMRRKPPTRPKNKTNKSSETSTNKIGTPAPPTRRFYIIKNSFGIKNNKSTTLPLCHIRFHGCGLAQHVAFSNLPEGWY